MYRVGVGVCLIFAVADGLITMNATPPPGRARCTITAAAKKKPPRRSGADGAGRGFAKPSKPVHAAKPRPTLATVVKGFPDRLPTDPSAPCPCGAGAYAACCQPFHLGELLPDSPTRVLLSRFSAFAFRLPLHLIRTTHSSNRDWREDRVAWARQLNREGLFDDFDFVRLEAGEEEPGATDDECFITFRAVMRPRGDSDSGAGGEEMAFRERSRFVKDEAAWPPCWLYAGGEVVGEGAGLEDAVLNRG